MRKQKGIALITILVMVALATILAASIVEHQTNTRENIDYIKRQNQALLYAKSAEFFLKQLLIDDAKNAGNVDHLNENWAKPMPIFPIEGGHITGIIEDESGKFNLNNLLKKDGTINEPAKLWFEQLLVRVGLPAQLSEAVIDWQDENDQPVGAMGAESAYYLGVNNAALPSNQKFNSVEQLKQVRGFEAGRYKLIEPYVTAQPNIETLVNINTASGYLLASLDEQLNPETIQNELNQRVKNLKYFDSVDALWSLDSMKAIDDEHKKKFSSLLGVKSQYFKAKIEVILNGKNQQLVSYLHRDQQNVYVNSRSLVPFATLMTKVLE